MNNHYIINPESLIDTFRVHIDNLINISESISYQKLPNQFYGVNKTRSLF